MKIYVFINKSKINLSLKRNKVNGTVNTRLLALPDSTAFSLNSHPSMAGLSLLNRLGFLVILKIQRSKDNLVETLPSYLRLSILPVLRLLRVVLTNWQLGYFFCVYLIAAGTA